MSLFTKKRQSIDQIAAQIDAVSDGYSIGSLSPMDALKCSTVLACVDAIATTVSVPDLHVMRKDGEVSKRATDDPAYRILHRRPNDWQTAMQFRQQITTHAALTGMGIAIPTYDDNGRLLELIPTTPEMRTIVKNDRYDIEFQFSDEFGPIGNWKSKDLLIIRNMNWEMHAALPALKLANNAISLAIEAETNIATLQNKGGRPSGILSTDGKLNEDTYKRIVKSFRRFQTKRDAFGTALLDNGMKYTPMGMTAVDQQTDATRSRQVEEICRTLGVFPQIVMHSDKAATFASAEAFFSAHNRLTAGKWQKAWVETCDEFILDGAGPLFVEFDNRGMQAASLKDSGEYYYKAIGAGNSTGWMTPNEIREERGLPPIEGGNELFKPPVKAPSGDSENDVPPKEEE